MTSQDPRPGAIRVVVGLPVDPSGRMKVGEHLRCLDDPNVIGAGDAIVAPAAVAAHPPMGCATALLLGLKQPTHCWPRSVEPHYRLPGAWVLPWR